MVKAYLRYEPEGALGVITSAPSIAYVLDGARNGMNSSASASASATAAASSSSSQHRRLLVAAGSLEAVALWDAATGELVARLDPPPSPATGARAREVTSLASLVGSSGSGNSGSGIGGSFLASPQRPLLAVGHADGRVRLWDVSERRMDASLAGHSSAVTCLAFDDDCGSGGGGIGEEGEDGGTSGGGGGNLLASGGADTDVVVWDVGAESGLCRLRGHAAPVTAVCFVVSSAAASDSSAAALLAAAAAAKNPNAKLLSSSSSSSSLSSAKKLLVASAAKDGCVRLWHLAAGGACVCTVATGSGELWALSPAPASFAAGAGGNGAGTLLAGAGVGGEVLLWRVGEAAVGGNGGGTGDDENGTAAAATATTTSRSLPALLPSGTLRRSAPDRATSLSWSVARGGGGGGGAGGAGGGDAAAAATAAGEVPVLVCASSGRVVDVWRGRSAADARRHAARRAKRRRDKDAARAVENGGGGGGAGAPPPSSSSAAAAAVEVEAADALEALPALRLKHRVRAAALCPAALLSSSGTPSAGKRRNRAHCPSARLALALSNNVLEFWDVAAAAASSSDAASERASSIDGPGHRAPVRALALAPDGRLALAASGDGSAKLWNVETMQHVRSVEPLGSGERGGDGNNSTSTAAVGEGGALSALWAPGGRHAVLGAKAGSLWLVDAATGSASRLLSSSHAGPVWSLSALPDGSGFVSASADKDVKFWEWEVVSSSVSTSTSNPLPSVSARHVRSLRLADDALCAKVSPDGRYLAVALLDSTIQVFHADSLKFALALYGHALPALAFDISSDGALLVSGGADKSVRVWGLDFGDCHRSMRGHADSVTAVSFVPGTHHVFTASKDGSVRYWDADAWQNLLVLDGPGGGFGGGSSGPELWCLAVSQDGSLVLSGGADRAVRAWRRGDEPFFVEEENERRLESMFDADADAQAAARANASVATGKDPSSSSLAPGDATTAARPTAEALTAADELVEAMDLADEEDRRREAAAASSAAAKEAEEEGGGAAAKGASKRKRQQQMQQQEAIAAAPSLPPSFQPNPLLLGLSPDAFVLRALRGVKPADLEAAALSLPLADALRLLSRVRSLLLLSSSEGGGGGNKSGCPASPELLVRAATLLVRVHAPALAGSRAARSALSRLKGPLREAARGARDALAENEAALRHLCRAARARGRVA